MFWRMLSGSLRHQRARLTVAVLAMALGSTLVSALLNLSGDIGGQVGQQLRAYGANILIRPSPLSAANGTGTELAEAAAARTMAVADLEAIGRVKGVMGVVPYLYALVEAQGRPVVLAGVDLAPARSVNGWWQVNGAWPQAADEVLVGVRAAAALDLLLGQALEVKYGDRSRVLRVAGTLDTGGPEDDQLVAPLLAVQELASQPGKAGLALVSALATDRPLEAVARELQALLPDAEVRPLAQLAKAESRVLDRVRLLIGLVAALVLVAGGLTVAGTLNTIVVERRGEIGLMKSLGAADRRVASLFLAEALSVGTIGGAVGYLAGTALALAIGRHVFDAAVTPAAWGLPGTLLVGLAVTLAAGLFPVQGALKVDPVKTLRGE